MLFGHWGRLICILMVGAVQIEGFSTSFTVCQQPKVAAVLKNSCGLPRFAALPFIKGNGLRMNSHSPESSEAFPEKENYTDEEVEELVTKAEKLWEKALAARKLAEDLSEQADKLADEIESKVSYPAQKPVQIII
jgi:hypothetical protein